MKDENFEKSPDTKTTLRQYVHFERIEKFGPYIRELRDVFLTDHAYQIIKPFVGVVWRGISVGNVGVALKTYQPGKDFLRIEGMYDDVDSDDDETVYTRDRINLAKHLSECERKVRAADRGIRARSLKLGWPVIGL